MNEQATIDPSEIATAEQIRTLTFEAMSDVKIPLHDAWMDRASNHRVILALGWGSLRH